MSSILPYKVFGKRLAKNSRILRYTKARLKGTHPPLTNNEFKSDTYWQFKKRMENNRTIVKEKSVNEVNEMR